MKDAADELEIRKGSRRSVPMSAASSTSSVGSDPTAPGPSKRMRVVERTGPNALRFRIVDETRYLVVQYMNEARSNMRDILFEKIFFPYRKDCE